MELGLQGRVAIVSGGSKGIGKAIEKAAAEAVPLAEMSAQFDAQEAAKIPLGRVGESSDVVGLVMLLASGHAGWVTGSSFHINGGKLRAVDVG